MSYIPPVYPDAIPSLLDLPDRQDDIDWYMAARYNEIKKELRAALTELGTLPKGAYSDVKTRLDTIQRKSIVRAYRSGVQSNISSGVYTKVELNAVDFDIYSEMDIITNHRFVAIVSDYYHISGAIQFYGGSVIADKPYIAALKKSGVYHSYGDMKPSIDGNIIVPINDIVHLNAGQYLELWAYQATGSNTVDINGVKTVTWLAIHQI